MIYNNNPKSSTVSKTAIKMSEKIELFSIPWTENLFWKLHSTKFRNAKHVSFHKPAGENRVYFSPRHWSMAWNYSSDNPIPF